MYDEYASDTSAAARNIEYVPQKMFISIPFNRNMLNMQVKYNK
jgi:hypothetical protein